MSMKTLETLKPYLSFVHPIAMWVLLLQGGSKIKVMLSIEPTEKYARS